jgi:hypothetical protein
VDSCRIDVGEMDPAFDFPRGSQTPAKALFFEKRRTHFASAMRDYKLDRILYMRQRETLCGNSYQKRSSCIL